MSQSHFDQHEHDPVANLHMQPAKGILKVKSIDDSRQDVYQEESASSSAVVSNIPMGMTRSESKSHKIPHFDEMNIIATYHPPGKDYGHMKIEEPKTPYAPNDLIDEEMETEDSRTVGIDPSALVEKLKESASPTNHSTREQADRSSDDDAELSGEASEHRREFEKHRKRHYNEFEVVRMRRKEIEEELRALEQEDQSTVAQNSAKNSTPTDSIKPILIHHDNETDCSSAHHHHYNYHVHVEDDHQDDQTLTPEEREKKRQFEMKRKKHYNEFRNARLAEKQDDDETNG